MKLTITLGELKKEHGCERDCKQIYEYLQKKERPTADNTEITILEIMNILDVKAAYRALGILEYKSYCPIIADVVESAIHLYEQEYPDDNRIRDCIQTIRDYGVEKKNREQLQNAEDAAFAAADAATIAEAVYIAYAAATAVDAAFTAATYIAYATNTWTKNEEILQKYIDQNRR